MKIRELYNQARNSLRNAGIDSDSFEALCLMQKFFGIDRVKLSVRENDEAEQGKAESYMLAIQRRCNGEPLQYILGEWTLCGYPFKVGDGVLVPRQETEILVSKALEAVKGIKSPVIFDLCGGTGCISICLAKLRPDAKIYCIELSDISYWFISENIDLNEVKNVIPIKGDVLKGYLGLVKEKCDLLVSNPPYIKSEQIKTLPTDVQREPTMALDGGSDGLKFYRAIAEKWTTAVKSGGKVAFEIGMGQAPDVCQILRNNGYFDIRRYKDLAELDRVIMATVL